jgi:hypothetical protein
MLQGNLKHDLLFYVGFVNENQNSSQSEKQVHQLVLQGRNQNKISTSEIGWYTENDIKDSSTPLLLTS